MELHFHNHETVITNAMGEAPYRFILMERIVATVEVQLSMLAMRAVREFCFWSRLEVSELRIFKVKEVRE